jgi:ribosome-binding factor A
MPEKRGRKYHRDRVAETLRDEIGAMIEGELSDPRISFAYVSQVVVNPGGKSALIYVAVDGGLQEEADTLDGLMAARGYIRHGLLERMGVRYVPELTFHIDRSDKMKARIDELLGRRRKKQAAANRAQGTDEQSTLGGQNAEKAAGHGEQAAGKVQGD